MLNSHGAVVSPKQVITESLGGIGSSDVKGYLEDQYTVKFKEVIAMLMDSESDLVLEGQPVVSAEHKFDSVGAMVLDNWLEQRSVATERYLDFTINAIKEMEDRLNSSI